MRLRVNGSLGPLQLQAQDTGRGVLLGKGLQHVQVLGRPGLTKFTLVFRVRLPRPVFPMGDPGRFQFGVLAMMGAPRLQ